MEETQFETIVQNEIKRGTSYPSDKKHLYVSLKNKYNVIYPTDFEECLKASFLNKKFTTLDKVTFDLNKVLFIDVATLLNITATLNRITTKYPKCEIAILLPENFQVIRFLCTWNFKEAIEAAISDSTKTKFYSFLTSRDERRYDAAIDLVLENERKAKVRVSDSLESLTFKKFFSIYSFDITDYYKNKQLILDFSQEKTDEWKKEDIKNILNKYIKDAREQPSNGYIGNNIFFECITNALRHPQGTLLQTTSKFTKRKRVLNFLNSTLGKVNEKEVYATDNFSLVFWDNGNNMIDTLKGVVEKGKSIRTAYTPLHFPMFRVNFNNEENPEKSRPFIPINSNITPNKSHDEFIWLLSTFFPGISRDSSGETHIKNHDERSKTTFDFEQPGMGLCCLLDTAVKAFNGEIVVRTHQYRMVIKKAATRKFKGHNFDYLVSIKKKKGIPLFNGNLFAVHIPVYKNYIDEA